jgi:single-stranded DNA-binding protein
MTGQIFLSGRLVAQPKVSTTAKGKIMVRILLEVEQWRQVSRSECRLELTELPILAFSLCAKQLRDLRPGAAVVLMLHLNGTKYTPPEGGEARPGVQLVCDEVSFPPALRPAQTVRELPLT